MRKLAIHSVIRRKKKKYQPSNPEAKPIFHSDRGCQYTSRVFRIKLQGQGMEQSMSRVGHCIDNDPTEGLWGIIKSEMYCMYEISDSAVKIRNILDSGYCSAYNFTVNSFFKAVRTIHF